nr:hypothetical protein [Pseudomonas sp.]
MKRRVKRFDDFDEDIILYIGDISRSGYELITHVCQQQKLSQSAYLVLITHGGDPHAGYRIARCLRHHYGDFKLLVPDICKSAGTLIAIGAHELVIADRGELGPLDIQMTKPDELMERSSGMDIQQGLELLRKQTYSAFEDFMYSTRARTGISTKMAAEISAKLAGSVFQPVYGQIDPIRLGEIFRANTVGFEYGKRLETDSRNLKANALLGLITGYPAHSFVIDRKEAGTLFERVRPPDEREIKLLSNLYTLLPQLSDDLIFNWNSKEIEVQHADQQPEANAEAGHQLPVAEGAGGGNEAGE